MFGVVKGVIGGGVMNLVAKAVSVAFPPAALLMGVGQMLASAVGAGIKEAVSTLVKQAGMPKFIGKAVEALVDQALGSHKSPAGELGSFLGKEFGKQVNDFRENFVKNLVEQTIENMKGKKKGAGSWYEALADALGTALNKQAAKVEQMSAKITNQNAQDKPKDMTDLQAASQRLSFMMSSVDQVLKTIGEGLNKAAGRN